MKNFTIISEIVVALLLTITTTLLIILWPIASGTPATFKGVVALVTLLYCASQLSRAERRAGTITLSAVVLLALTLPSLFGGSDRLLLTIAIALVWGVRGWVTRRRPLALMIDLLVTLIALAAATWALSAGGLIAAVWLFFLLQALTAARLDTAIAPAATTRDGDDSRERFNRAHRNAEQALRTLICREP